MKTKLISGLFLLYLTLIMATNLTAQVTIGAGTAPAGYSVLEISTSETKGGLRLPQLSTTEREALSFTSSMGTVPNQGLTIYNLDTRCVEYWDNNKWVSLCLGTANITLSSGCGDYDKANPPVSPANGTPTNCIYTPVDNPACSVPSGQAYQVYLTAGSSYTEIAIDAITSAFSLTFQANNSSSERIAVVRVVNNCSGEFQDFIFLQAGGTCPAGDLNPQLNISNTTLCNMGSAFVNINNARTDIQYIWTLNGVVVHTGTYFEITRAGIYTIYAGLLGCGTPATVTVTGSPSSEAALPPIITTTNSGILCNGGNIILTANNLSGAGSIQWFHNGVPASTTNPLTVSGASAAGEWFASVTDGTCYSPSSNVLLLIDQTSLGTSLPAPTATVNGQTLGGGGLVICQNGTLSLNITNAASYPANTTYEWFINGNSISRSSEPNILYTVNTALNSSLTLSVQASSIDGSCPNTSISLPTNVSFAAPQNPVINLGAARAYLCGTTAASLVASQVSAQNYEWYRDGVYVATTGAGVYTYEPSLGGNYRVRIKDTNGCWSTLSPQIEVVQSSVLSLQWGIAPAAEVIVASTENYSVLSAPPADNYIWTVSDGVTNYPFSVFSGGTSIAVNYPSTPTTGIVVKVTGTNGCGSVSMSKTVDVVAGCSPVTSVSINPGGSILTVGQTAPTFTATSSNAESFEWRLDNVVVSSASTYTYSALPGSEGNHVLSVTASTTCSGGSSASAQVNIRVNPNVATIPTETSGYYKLTGKTCFDVSMTSSTNCGNISNRPNAFAGGLLFSYTFTNTAGYTNLSFFASDPGILLVSDLTNDKTFTITFRTDIRTFIQTNGLQTVTLYAIFNDNLGQIRKLSLPLTVKDCQCCPGYLSIGGVYTQAGNVSGSSMNWTTIASRFGKTGQDLCFYKNDVLGSNGNPLSAYSNAQNSNCTNKVSIDESDRWMVWRAPNVVELSLLNPVYKKLATEATADSRTVNLISASYWSSTLWVQNELNTFRLGWNFSTGVYASGNLSANTLFYIRCVSIMP